jgi:uncharacterized membrane protein
MDSKVIIERPVEEVCGFVADPSNIPSIDPSVQSVEKSSEGPLDVGTTFRMRRKAPLLGKPPEASMRCTAVEPNREIELEAIEGPITPAASLTFERADGATRVWFRGEQNQVGRLKVLSSASTRQEQSM